MKGLSNTIGSIELKEKVLPNGHRKQGHRKQGHRNKPLSFQPDQKVASLKSDFEAPISFASQSVKQSKFVLDNVSEFDWHSEFSSPGLYLLLGDILSLLISLSLVSLIGSWIVESTHSLPVGKISPAFDIWPSLVIMIMAACIGLGYLGFKEHYSGTFSIPHEQLDLFKFGLLFSGTLAAGIIVFGADVTRSTFLLITAMVLLAAQVSRFLTRIALKRLSDSSRPVVVIGRGVNAQKVVAKLREKKLPGMSFIGRLDFRDGSFPEVICDIELTDTTFCGSRQDSLEGVSKKIHDFNFDRNIEFIYAPDSLTEITEDQVFLERLSSWGRSVTFVPPVVTNGFPLYNSKMNRVFAEDFVLFRHTPSRSNAEKKRIFDVTLTLIIILLLMPVLVVLCLLNSILTGYPIYKAVRVGYGGKLFHCYKFRTMCMNADEVLSNVLEDEHNRFEWETTFKLKNDPRITKFGKFLRKYSLDELPQLFNVLGGSMSLVGPRPILVDEVERYGESLTSYCKHKPGITGLWQISGRSDLAYDQRIELNKWYFKNSSYGTDIKILCKTVPAVVFGSGL